MKKIIFGVILIACSNALIAQQLYDTTQSKKNENQLAAEAYFKKAKSQKNNSRCVKRWRFNYWYSWISRVFTWV
jgi:hypothetical protein